MFFFFIKDPLPKVEYPEQVYHYTNANAFLGIIKNKELWASHILFQNDKKEALYSLDLLSESLYENKAAFAKNNIDIQKLLSYIKPLTGQQIFTISFSEKRTTSPASNGTSLSSANKRTPQPWMATQTCSDV